MFELRRVVDAVLYLLRTGCQWRALPHDFPPWTAVFYRYAERRRRGTRERINAALRERHRAANGRGVRPTAAIVDGQSARTTEAGGPRGYDRGEKVSGRKRHTLVDAQGNPPKVRVRPADLHDRRGTEPSPDGLDAEFPRIALVWADSAYQGLKARLAATLDRTLTISKRRWTGLQGVWVAPGQQPPEIPRGFHVLERRRVVERRFARIGRNRRTSRDHERLIETGEMLAYASVARATLRRPAK